ncbi:hypothetical protein [Epilithonimonas arachidiradicis]|uniref:DoxX-like protein n=1 Tax=Epilithonimonas arachidiradicis TaxID=1617282 RepID=A0A420CPG9_9FLAO|nr:hypothetical protein [Epilithonimonas arachidiradicis]RKE80297.1 hypothetical protein BXY58_2813 [Epilithonimonas arachidiradicis]GGG64649.1 hypothetical protein GCM10007332_28840 [Epilithonimonas arachidiradicis]
MIKSIISLILLIVSVILNLKHGWESLNYKNNPQSLKMMNDLGINETYIPVLGVSIILIAILLLIPKTFFLGNVLNAMSIVLIMALAMRVGNFKMVLMEIPFLMIPLVMIGLRYPFKN